jgi:hypothetical protein
MNRAIKAALFSGLVFPGIGHIYLKHYWRGLALALAATLAVSGIIIPAVQQAQVIANKVLSGEIALDAAAITAQVDAATSGGDSLLLNTAYAVFIICWLIGIADSYRLGRAFDK